MILYAHAIGGRADLPAEPWLFAYGTVAALLIAFATLRTLWPRPRLATAAAGRPAPSWLGRLATVVRVPAQALVLLAFLATLWAAWTGPDSVSDNLAPTALYLAFWVGVQLASAVLGDVWRHVNPLWVAAAGLDRIRGRDPEASTATGWWASHWPAALALGSFLWLQVAFHDPAAITAVAAFLSAYTVVALVGATRFGAGWLRTADGFAVLFSLLAALAPLHRDDAGRLRLRVPGAGLATVDVRPGTLAVVFVVLGGTAFDGLRETDVWSDVAAGRRGWELTAVSTIGLALTVATVAVAYLVAIRLVGRTAGDDTELGDLADRWAPALVPIALGYVIAHHSSPFVFEGQRFWALASDPFGAGWDLFGTASHRIDYTLISTGLVASVQGVAMALGLVVAVVAVHDRAVARYGPGTAVRAETPLLAVLVAAAVAGPLLLLGS